LTDICYACEKEIIERDAPPAIGHFQKVGKYTIRRQAWDKDWKPINEDTYFHEECYYKGFIFAIKHGWLYGEMMKAIDLTTADNALVKAWRRDNGVDHS
jgi:hypothetical protein